MLLIENIIQGELVNGSVGKVISFSTSSEAIKAGLRIARPQQETENAAASQKSSPHIPQDPPPTSNPNRPHGPELWPVVRFTSGMTYLCVSTQFDVRSADDTMKAQRTQVCIQ